MKVKVGNMIYDGEYEPVMVILTDQDKENIKNMLPECASYCMYPSEKHSVEEIRKWMKET